MMSIRTHIVLAIVAILAGGVLVEVTEPQTEELLRYGRSLLSGAGQDDGTTVTLDTAGIPLVDYGELEDIAVGAQRNPVAICQHAFHCFDNMSDSPSVYFRQALGCANWLVDSAEVHTHGAILPYRFAYPRYGLRENWLSAMAQAQAVQVMVRTHGLTGDSKFLDHARSLLGVFFVDVDSGGVTHKRLAGTSGWWYEEYAAPDGDDPRVLNGMLFVLVGLNELYEYSGDTTSELLFARGLKAVVDLLAHYDRNGHSYYDALGNPVGGDYHQVHIDLLDTLYRLTGRSTLAKYRDRWRAYADSPLVVRLVRAPTRMGPVVLAVNVLITLAVLELGLIARSRRRNASRTVASGTGR